MKSPAPFLLFSLLLFGCSQSQPGSNPQPASAEPTPSATVNDASDTAKFHVTGTLLNKDRTPAIDQKVVLEEISGEKGDRKSTITFGIENGTTKLSNPSATTDATGHFDIEIDIANAGKEYGLTVLNLKTADAGNPRKPPYLSVNGKRVTFKVQGGPGEVKLGEIIMK